VSLERGELLAEELGDCLWVLGVDGALDFPYGLRQFHPCGSVYGAHDAGVAGGLDSFLFVMEGFEEPLARPQSTKDDGDVYVGFEAFEPDEFLGDVGDPDGFAHVEDEEVAVFADGGGLEDEADGFTGDHKVAFDLGVGDGEGAAAGDLAFEDGQLICNRDSCYNLELQLLQNSLPAYPYPPRTPGRPIPTSQSPRRGH
jgi:hypothetical protein